MKKILIIIIATVGAMFTSCSSTYYYSTLNTVNYDVEKVENGDFLFQNDSLWIAYCFKGEDAPIQITVFNKLDIPLYVDWNRSSLILNDAAYPYSDGNITYSGNTESTTYSYGGIHDTRGVTQGSVTLPKHVTFIPPKTMTSHNTLRLSAQFHEISDKEYTKATMGVRNYGKEENVSIKRINYDMQNTPLRFGSYLTIYAKPEKPQSYRTDFYVTNLIKTKVAPSGLPSNMADRGDTFYQHKRPNNTGWEILGVTTIVAGAVVVDALVSDGDCYHCY